MRRLLPMLAAAAALVPTASSARAEEPAEWAARHVLIAYRGAERTNATRTKEEARALAEKIAAEARLPGADFTRVAAANSDCPSRAQGGFLGIFPRGQMTPKFQQAVEGLKEGEVSGVVETPFGYHVIQRVSKADALAEMAKDRAILIVALFGWKGLQPPPTLRLPVPLPPTSRSKDAALEDATRAMEHLKAGGTFDSLPPPLLASPLQPGWQPLALARSRGHLPAPLAPLEEQGYALGVGEVSKPIETAIGYAVLRRIPYFRAHLQHFLVSYRGAMRSPPTVTRTKEEARARAQEALAKYEADRSAWRRLVAEYSDEPDAGAREGDLGTAESGQFVPEFDAAVATLKPGEHTKVFESGFGFHVARRID